MSTKNKPDGAAAVENTAQNTQQKEQTMTAETIPTETAQTDAAQEDLFPAHVMRQYAAALAQEAEARAAVQSAQQALEERDADLALALEGDSEEAITAAQGQKHAAEALRKEAQAALDAAGKALARWRQPAAFLNLAEALRDFASDLETQVRATEEAAGLTPEQREAAIKEAQRPLRAQKRALERQAIDLDQQMADLEEAGEDVSVELQARYTTLRKGIADLEKEIAAVPSRFPEAGASPSYPIPQMPERLARALSEVGLSGGRAARTSGGAPSGATKGTRSPGQRVSAGDGRLGSPFKNGGSGGQKASPLNKVIYALDHHQGKNPSEYADCGPVIDIPNPSGKGKAIIRGLAHPENLTPARHPGAFGYRLIDPTGQSDCLRDAEGNVVYFVHDGVDISQVPDLSPAMREEAYRLQQQYAGTTSRDETAASV